MTNPTDNQVLEKAIGGIPLVRDQGLNTNKAANFSGMIVDTSGNATIPGTLIVTGAQTFTGNTIQSGSETVTGVSTVTGGLTGPGTMPTVFHSGGYNPLTTTGANQKQIVTTETYYCEVYIPVNTTITGISLLLGHTTAAQNVFVGLANSAGTIVANSNTTTAMGTADTFQQIPFTTPYSAIGPSKYFIAVQSSQTTGFIATHAALGNFGAGKITSETYGTFLTTATYKSTTYTASLGPIADTY